MLLASCVGFVVIRGEETLNKSTYLRILALLLTLAFAATACTSDSSLDAAETADASDTSSDAAMVAGDCTEGTINVSGSSTVEPISSRAAELYEDACGADISITVNGPGTGDGFKSFCEGDIDIADASRQIKDKEIADCAETGVEFTELKVAFDGIAVMSSQNNDIECLSFADLYSLLGGESEGFSNWADAQAIASELGSATDLPDAALDISAPGTESGTYDSFIEIVLEGIAEDRQGEGAQLIRQDFSGNADDNIIIEGVLGSDSSLGWAGFAFAEANKDRVKSIQVSEEPGGDCVAPTVETIADGSYPVSRGLYIYVNNAKVASNPALAGYVDYYLGAAYDEAVTKTFGDSGYVALPADQKAATDAAWAAVKG